MSPELREGLQLVASGQGYRGYNTLVQLAQAVLELAETSETHSLNLLALNERACPTDCRPDPIGPRAEPLFNSMPELKENGISTNIFQTPVSSGALATASATSPAITNDGTIDVRGIAEADQYAHREAEDAHRIGAPLDWAAVTGAATYRSQRVADDWHERYRQDQEAENAWRRRALDQIKPRDRVDFMGENCEVLGEEGDGAAQASISGAQSRARVRDELVEIIENGWRNAVEARRVVDRILDAIANDLRRSHIRLADNYLRNVKDRTR